MQGATSGSGLPEASVSAAHSKLQAQVLGRKGHDAGLGAGYSLPQRHADNPGVAHVLFPQRHCTCICQDGQKRTVLRICPGSLTPKKSCSSIQKVF